MQDTAQNQGFGKRMAGVGKVPDVIVRKSVHGSAPFPAHAARMGSDGDVEIEARAPEGIVIVRAFQSQRIDVVSHFGRVCTVAEVGRNRAAHMIGDHDRLHTQFPHGVSRLGDGLLRRVHWHDGSRRHAMRVGPEYLGIHQVHGA